MKGWKDSVNDNLFHSRCFLISQYQYLLYLNSLLALFSLISILIGSLMECTATNQNKDNFVQSREGSCSQLDLVHVTKTFPALITS